MRKFAAPLAFYLLVAGIVALAVRAQNAPLANVTPIQATQSLYFTTPISATAAVNTQTVLTIPAPPAGLYNYVCKFAINVSNDSTGSGPVTTNQTFTVVNLGSPALVLKIGLAVTANVNYDSPTYNWGDPATGCAKSVLPATATTFTSVASQTHTAWTFYATYYQAP